MTSLASLVRGLRQWTEADAATDVGVGKKAKGNYPRLPRFLPGPLRLETRQGNYVLATCVSGCA